MSGCPTPAENGPEGPKEGGEAGEGDKKPARATREIDLFAFGQVLGQLEPCGCTTEPLGGLQYAFGYIEQESKADARLILEPGSFLFPDPEHPEAPRDEAGWVQAEKKADTLQSAFARLGDDLVSGLGPTDYARPAQSDPHETLARWKMPRVLANLSEAGRKGAGGIVDHRVVDLGEGAKAVVTAVVEPSSLLKDSGFPETTEPLEAATAALAKAKDAQLSVVMASGSREFAESLAKALEVDIVLMGGHLEGADRGRTGTSYARVSGSWLIEPGDRTQTLTHLRLVLDAKDGANALDGEWTIVESIDKRKQALELLNTTLAEMKKDPSADEAFVAKKQRERDELAAALESDELPDAPAVATFSQIPVTCRGKSDDDTLKSMRDYTAWVATENKKRFTGVEAPPAKKGERSYVGIKECAECHEEAVEFWQGTHHANAYETLERDNKQFDLTCVSCHVTGFRKPGGSEVVELKGLDDVQCEQCHGPGSEHIEDPSPENIQREAPDSVCAQCHTPEHSDTFEYKAYLRDIVGKGHGEDARAKLGDGPTGHDLRQAGFAKAGGSCKKM
jgi:nucleotide-binding universal stress UspA family protein